MGSEKEEKPAENGKENGKEENGKEEADEKPTQNGDVEADTKKSEEKEPEAEEDGEESEEELGLLDKPVEILTTKRQRKSTEFLVNRRTAETPAEIEIDYTKGKGTMLKDIPYVTWQINKADTEDLYVLHRLMYKKQGKHQMVKRNIRQFCGYPFDKKDKAYKYVEELAWRLVLPALRWINGILGLEKSQDKEKMRDDLLEFLMEPKDTGKEVPAKTTPKSAKKKKKSKTPKKKSDKKVKETKDESGGSDVSEASDDSDDEEKEEKEEKEKEKKPAKSHKKKPTPKKKASKPTPVKIAMPMKKKSATKKRKSEAKSEDSGDDEPLVKKTKGPPTDADLKKVVGAILKDADLEQVTMKNVVKEVYDQYSEFDLTSRKDFIKTCVKELIS